MAVFAPGPGEPRSLARLNNQKASYANILSPLNYNSTINTSQPVSLKDISEFFNNPSSEIAPHFVSGEPFKMSEWSSFKEFEKGQEEQEFTRP